MLNPVRATWDFLRGADLKTVSPAAPTPPAPELKQAAVVFTTDGYVGLGIDYWNPAPGAPPAAGYAQTLNSAVFACLKLLSQAFQEAPLRVFRHAEDGTDEWLDDQPFMELLADPHPSLSQPELNWWLVWCLNVAGNAYLRKIRDLAGAVVQLWPISASQLTPETDEADRAGGVFISRYVYDDGQGHRETIPVADVVHFRLGVDDADHRLGVSPLVRLLREIASDEEATAFREYLLKNVGVSSLVVTTPDRTLTAEQAQQLKDNVEARFTGTNRGRVGVLNNGATVTQLGYNPQQLDLKAAHQIPETRICAVLGVPPMLVGVMSGLEHTIYNNMEQAQQHLYEQTVIALWRQVAATYQKQLLRPDFEADLRVLLRYDTAKVPALQEDVNEVYARNSVAVEKGWLTKDEARAEVGLPPLPDGLGEAEPPGPVPPQLVPPGAPPPGQEAPPEQQQQGRRRLGERKALGLSLTPALMDTLLDLATPALEQDLQRYFEGQRERVMA